MREGEWAYWLGNERGVLDDGGYPLAVFFGGEREWEFCWFLWRSLID